MNKIFPDHSIKSGYVSSLNSLEIKETVSGLNCASFFSGGGGLDLGFAIGGFENQFSSDIVQHYCDTLSSNLNGASHTVETKDISELPGSEILKKSGGSIDMVIGGPPCQSFSILGSRGSTIDPRGQLVYEYARVIQEIRPRAFLFENVPGIQSVNGGKDWNDLLKFFRNETGFHLRVAKLNAADFGVPQIRHRIILLGFREKHDEASFSWPEATHFPNDDLLKNNAYVCASEALSDVDGLPNHILRNHSQRVIDRYSLIKPGERDRKDHTDRIDPTKPSGTVLVGSGAGGGRPFIHPYEHRHITVREAARLQSFPDWWVFSGGPTAAYRQVGNAVPPLLAKAIAEQIRQAFG